MDDLALKELQKYETLWRSFPEYRKDSPADDFTPLFLAHFQDRIRKGDAIIDFGCGTGRSAKFLMDLEIHLVDLCENSLDPDIFLLTVGSKPSLHFIQGCLWDLPASLKAADWILCFDTLEHLPEETIDASLAEIASRMKRGGLLSITLCEDVFGRLIGQRLHLTVKPAHFWKEYILRYFCIEKEFFGNDNTLILALTPL